MYLEQTLKLQQWISSLQEPQRIFAYLGIYLRDSASLYNFIMAKQ